MPHWPARRRGGSIALLSARTWQANHLLCELLVYLQSPSVIAKTTALLARAERSEDLLHYLFFCGPSRTDGPASSGATISPR